MARRLALDAVESEIASVRSLIASIDKSDLIAHASLSSRLEVLEEEASTLEQTHSTLGSVILSFEGAPVEGSRGIDAEFATETLRAYQELISKQVANLEGFKLPRSGPVPLKDFARLKITNVVHGSFGFQLEESNDEPEFMDSAIKKAISTVDSLIADFSSPTYENFEQALASVDRRVFLSMQKFFESLFRDSASVKIFDDTKAYEIDNRLIVGARERLQGLKVRDEQFDVPGELLGLAPIQRRFDFQPVNGVPPISGRVGQRLSDNYLERLHGEQRISGRLYRAKMQRRIARRADGFESISYTLLDLAEPNARFLETFAG